MLPTVRRIAAAVLTSATLVLSAAGAAFAQEPPAPKNLKVLPKDMPRREVVEIMRGWSHALGMKCAGCHESTKPGSERPDDLDFASDKKPEKETARRMVKLLYSINDQIGQMGLKDPVQVRCVTCHRGLSEPQTLEAALQKSIARNGVDGSIADYRRLRERYYGTGSYDFSPSSLNAVATDLAGEKKDYDGAVKLLETNLEFNPRDAETWATLGQVQLAKGDKAAAIKAYERALEIDPNNRWAKAGLERAKGGQ